MPSGTQGGRRAAQATAAPMENDQSERNAALRKVQARDLVEFGMIPVSKKTFKKDATFLPPSFCHLKHRCLCVGICWSFPCTGAIP